MFSLDSFQQKIDSISKNKHWMSEYLRFSCNNHTIFWFLVIKTIIYEWNMKISMNSPNSCAMSYGPLPNFDLQPFFTATFWAISTQNESLCLFSQNRETDASMWILRNCFGWNVFSGTCIDWCWCGQWWKISVRRMSHQPICCVRAGN